MTTKSVRVHIDDRGASKQLADMWIPHLDVDVVWLVGAPVPEDPDLPGGVTLVELAATDVAALAAEIHEDARRALVVFTSPTELGAAAAFGLPPCGVTLIHLQPDGTTERLGPEVETDATTLAAFESLQERGFTFEIQPLPNVTARPWAPHPEGDSGAVEHDPS